MSQVVREWLPAQALADAGGTAAAMVAGQWSEHWFARHRLEVTGVKVAASGLAGPWRVPGAAIGVRASAGGVSKLLAWALDASPDQRARTARDKELLCALEDRLLSDLTHRLEKEIGASAAPAVAVEPLEARDGVVVALGSGAEREVLSVGIPFEMLVPWRKSRVLHAPAIPPALRPITAALGCVEVPLGVILGMAEITVSELREISVGDVLVLSKGLDEPVGLSLAGATTSFASAGFSKTKDRVSLLLYDS